MRAIAETTIFSIRRYVRKYVVKRRRHVHQLQFPHARRVDEPATLRQTVMDIPRRIAGVDEVEILVIDDGSRDGTSRVAREAGVEHVIRHKINKGLAQAFRSGIEGALRAGADIIVNTDGDNQYAGRSIPDLIRPILEGRADIVIGDRRPGENPDFSWTKRRLQAFGSFVVRRLSGTDVPDAVSGFRAISRQAALALGLRVALVAHHLRQKVEASALVDALQDVSLGHDSSPRPPVRPSARSAARARGRPAAGGSSANAPRRTRGAAGPRSGTAHRGAGGIGCRRDSQPAPPCASAGRRSSARDAPPCRGRAPAPS